MRKPCDKCGASFYVRPSHATRRKYCSEDCWMSVHRLDRAGPEPEPIHGARYLPLGGGHFAIVDADDYDAVARFAWYVGAQGYAVTPVRTRPGKGGRTIVFLHRLLMGHPPGSQIDHVNLHRLDCRRGNLRLATPTQNNSNRCRRTDKLKGVYRRCGKWFANVKANGVSRTGPRRSTQEEAALDYDRIAREMHGEFARVNFPVGEERSADEITLIVRPKTRKVAALFERTDPRSP